jgi:hypothetical protein
MPAGVIALRGQSFQRAPGAPCFGPLLSLLPGSLPRLLRTDPPMRSAALLPPSHSDLQTGPEPMLVQQASARS